MPIPSPFHPRTLESNKALLWKDWGGYYAARAYDPYFEREYYAFRHTAGMIDVTPLFKYEVYGPDATAFLTRIMSRNIGKLKQNQVTYCCWCDDEGKVVDDGTVSRFEENVYRVTAAEPTYAWFERYASEYDVTIEDSSARFAALSIQGPNSRTILNQASDSSVDKLGFFRMMPAKVGGVPAIISRTGYTGDLGYEVWVENQHALGLWDGLTVAGKNYGLAPAGLDAMDITRVEAGFIMNGVDYYSANH
ncbi:MAG: aminomethyl transferase family protein, partial [Candidatus Eisenbacteria bacterium]|nr:aminomethyl transferase family protein [Candidatus Eisenbacteria bacterium]